MVTTNFDDGFVAASAILGLAIESDRAPLLPPVRASWWTVVALHGVLTDLAPNDLVLTSAQFGEAYLTEGWAARFVAELFRRFRIIFVGYSVEDPVMRYVVDAYRAVDLDDQVAPKPYAFVGSTPERRERVEEQWRFKHVAPIWYETNGSSHQGLWDSLAALADLKERGAKGLSTLLHQHCQGPADLLTPDEQTRVEWALRQVSERRLAWTGEGPPPDGVLGALARISPPRMETWMEYLASLALLPRCGIVDRRPRVAGEMLVCGVRDEHISAGRWMATQLESPELIEWIVSNGSYLSPVTAATVADHISNISESYSRAWSFICQTALNPPYFGNDDLTLGRGAFTPGSLDAKIQALTDLTLPAIELRRPYSSTQAKTVDDLVRAEIVLPSDDHLELTHFRGHIESEHERRELPWRERIKPTHLNSAGRWSSW